MMTVGSVIITVLVTEHRLDSAFKVIYSLDERRNDKEIVSLIDGATKYVYFAVYYFSKDDIAQALIRAKERGVVVWGITDRQAGEDTNKAVLAKLAAAGVIVETQKHADGIMHMKVLVTDKAYASGSYNWTASATEANDEVLEIGRDDSVRRQYLEIIKRLLVRNE